MSNEKVIDIIRAFFAEAEWKYDFDEANSVFTTGVGGLDSGLKSLRIILDVREDFVISYTISPINGDEEARPALAEYIARANYGLIKGNFELDFNDGEIRYKNLVSAVELEADAANVQHLVFLSIQMFERYGKGMLQIMFGGMSPEDAINEAEQDMH